MEDSSFRCSYRQVEIGAAIKKARGNIILPEPKPFINGCDLFDGDVVGHIQGDIGIESIFSEGEVVHATEVDGVRPFVHGTQEDEIAVTDRSSLTAHVAEEPGGGCVNADLRRKN